MELVVLGIDQGNGNMKTASCVFPYGFKKQETKPSELFSKDILEYKGMYYSLTQNLPPAHFEKLRDPFKKYS